MLSVVGFVIRRNQTGKVVRLNSVTASNSSFTVLSDDPELLLETMYRAGVTDMPNITFYHSKNVHRAQQFKDFICQQFITFISLDEVNLTQPDFEVLCSILANSPSSSLKLLDLPRNHITHAHPLSSVLSTHTNIEKLLIRDNPLTDCLRDMMILIDTCGYGKQLYIDIQRCGRINGPDAHSLQRLIWGVPNLRIDFSTTDPRIPVHVFPNFKYISFIKVALDKGIPAEITRLIITSLHGGQVIT